MTDHKLLLKTNDINLTSEQLIELESLVRELLLWNEKVNLTAIREEKEVWLKHILDSLTILPVLPNQPFSMIDIGSGAGFPGLPIKIARPESSVVFLEAINKKTQFTDYIINKLNLTNSHTANDRAEVLAHEEKYREHFDVATARAVAMLPILLEYALPFIKVGGIFVAQKNYDEKFQEELTSAKNALEILGGRIKEIREINISGLSKRALVIIEKITPTPKDYPRKNGIPKVKPL